MADYDALFDFGIRNEYINTICEIPKGSMLKVEFDREKKIMVLDRVEPGIFAKPVNYGFIPRTLDEDGDALDTLIYTEEPLPVGVAVKARVVAVMNFDDGGENDHKIVCVVEDDRNWGDRVTSLADLPEAWKNQVEHHFNHYKDLKKPGTTKVLGWGDTDEAWKTIDACVEAFYKK
ncbi:MAG: ppa [Candidatus Saccharibacteria bacterium]|nr:ppa [Candidatus Saccharibacteria bacterium]